MKVKVLILNYNGIKHLPECLKSVKLIDYDNFEIVVIDNCSSDNSIKYIKKEHSDVTIISTDMNLMFGGGYNYFFNQDTEDCFYLILNNDTIVDSKILKHFLTGASHYGLDNIYGCKIMYESDSSKIWYAGAKVNLSNGLIRHEGIRQEGIALKDGITDYVTGCCMFISSSTVRKLGGFDTQFDMYMEDVDLCLRAKKEDIHCYFLKDPFLFHKVSGSSSLGFKIFKSVVSYTKLSIKHTGILSVFNIPFFLIRRIMSI
ncbi:MAG: hypothetical protein CMG11_03620 [Candidatus Marinimicrobia bacterium]|nr:hypothetical protein [Candidatus Neomarinimicrobiota bacterium]|tara:strand:- start:927 stop:1703 length:777 start_codon:yes stop_codon:yes gene_type:complete